MPYAPLQATTDTGVMPIKETNIIKPLIFLLTCIVLSSCNTINSKPSTDSEMVYMISGVSIEPPERLGWAKIKQSDLSITFGKNGESPGETEIFRVSIYTVKPITNSHELSQTIEQLRVLNQNTDRFTVISNEEELYGDYETCVRHHTISEDHKPPPETNASLMFIDSAGYNCSHSHANNIIVQVEVSQRRYPNSTSINTKQLAESMSKTVQMHRFD